MPIFNPIIDVPHTPYCGPTAISILTGVPLSRIEKMLRRERNKWNKGYQSGKKYAVKGTFTSEVVNVLKKLGCKVEKFLSPESTLNRFGADTEHVPTPFLVNVTSHFVVVCKGMFSDNSQITPVPAARHPRGNRRVQKVWRVIAPATPRYAVEQPAMTTPRSPKPKIDIKAVRARRIAEQVARWEAKERRAKNALKKLRPKLAYYKKLGVGEQAASL